MQITEQDIRRLAIGYLRMHYKYRPRQKWDGIRVVAKEHKFEGITIDARLTFAISDKEQFVATVEASSLDKSDEVYYRHHWFRLLFESLTLTLLAMAVVFGVLSTAWYGWLEAGGVDSTFLAGLNLLAGIWLLFATLLQLSFKRRYRYIYAVEQFKLFHADDQWIAFDSSLFSAHDDKRYQELERQSVRYGFGIMEVEKDRDVRVLVAPKRGDYFVKKRKKISFLASAPIIGKVLKKSDSEAEVADDGAITFQDPFQTMEFKPLGTTAADELQTTELEEEKKTGWRRTKADLTKKWELTLRTMMPGFVARSPGFFNPPVAWRNWLLFAIIFHLGLFIWKQSQETILPLTKEKIDLRLEDDFENRQPIDQQYEDRLNDVHLEVIEAEDYITATLPDDLDPVIDEDELKDIVPNQSSTDVMYYHLGIAGDTLVRDQCPRFQSAEGKLYGLVYGRYNNLDAALNTAFSLHATGGLDVNVVYGQCIEELATPYLILLGLPSADEGEINLNYRKLKRDRGFNVEILSF